MIILTNDDERHAIEPGAKVRERPQKDAKLERVDEVLDKEEPAKFADGCVGVRNGDVGNFMHLLRGQR